MEELGRGGRNVSWAFGHVYSAGWRSIGIAFLLFFLGIAQFASAQTHTLTSELDPVVAGREAYACWTAPSGSSALDYIALYTQGSPNGSYLFFAYTQGTESGCLSLPAPFTPGVHEFRYLLNNGTVDAATSSPFDVIASPGAYSLSLDPNATSVEGELFYVCWSAPAGTPVTDTIALFGDEIPPGAPQATLGTGGAASGCVSFTTPPAGPYVVRYLREGSLDVAEANGTSIVSPGAYSLTAAPDPVVSGRVVEACWTAPPGSSELDYVALYQQGERNLAYERFDYTDGTESGCLVLPVFGPPGTYELRYLLNNGWVSTVTSAPFEVIASPGSYTLTLPPGGTAVEGRTAEICWTATTALSPTDVISIFADDSPFAFPLEVRGTCGSESGCATFQAPPAGDYEIRYLYDETLDVQSIDFTTIASAGGYTLTATPTQVAEGADAEVCWTAPPGSSANDYVALYLVGEGNFDYQIFQYTGGTESGCATFSPLSPGTYEFRYLLNNGYADTAISNEFQYGAAPPLMDAHQWRLEVTGDPQDHPDFAVGQLVSARSFVPRGQLDGLPADPTVGSYGGGYAFLESLGSDWSLGSEMDILDDFSGTDDGVLLDADLGGRSVDLACTTDSGFYVDDGFKKDDVPIPALDCPGVGNAADLQDTNLGASVAGTLACVRYLPEPSLWLSVFLGWTALGARARQRRGRGSS